MVNSTFGCFFFFLLFFCCLIAVVHFPTISFIRVLLNNPILSWKSLKSLKSLKIPRIRWIYCKEKENNKRQRSRSQELELFTKLSSIEASFSLPLPSLFHMTLAQYSCLSAFCIYIDWSWWIGKKLKLESFHSLFCIVLFFFSFFLVFSCLPSFFLSSFFFLFFFFVFLQGKRYLSGQGHNKFQGFRQEYVLYAGCFLRLPFDFIYYFFFWGGGRGGRKIVHERETQKKRQRMNEWKDRQGFFVLFQFFFGCSLCPSRPFFFFFIFSPNWDRTFRALVSGSVFFFTV